MKLLSAGMVGGFLGGLSAAEGFPGGGDRALPIFWPMSQAGDQNYGWLFYILQLGFCYSVIYIYSRDM